MKEERPLQIDLRAILRKRLPKEKRKFVPAWLVAALARLVRQDDLNGILRRCHPKQGSDFASAALADLDITVEVQGEENIPKEGRFIFASNHPLGGLDGIALISVLGKKYGDENVRFLVNDMLMNVVPLQTVFLPINKYGSQGREATAVINATYKSDKQILIFPAGLVSRLHDDGEIRDLKWKKAFVVKAIQTQRDIIPVWFEGLNRKRFYRLAKWRKKLGVKVNLEQVLLPGELCAARGSRYLIRFGKPISWEEVESMPGTPAEKAQKIKSIIRGLKGGEVAETGKV